MAVILAVVGAVVMVAWAAYELNELGRAVKYSEELQELFKKGNEHE